MALEYNPDVGTGLGMTLQEFLAWEFEQEQRHEYANGEVIDFAGGTVRHSEIAFRLAARIMPVSGRCHLGGSDVLIQMESSARYADIVVTCDDRDNPTSRTVRFPKLIVEVLSESTAEFDRSRKLEEYTAIETLQEYLLVDSRRRWIQTIRRLEDGWKMSVAQTTGILRLASFDVAIDLDEVYAGLELGD